MSYNNSPTYIDLPTIDQLIKYLKKENWYLSSDSNDYWDVYKNNKFLDLYDQHIEIVIPKNKKAVDINKYINNTLALLSKLTDKSVNLVQQTIKGNNKDILRVRNLTTDETISIDIANRQITRINQLFLFSASSEIDPKPYYDKANSKAKSITKQCQFGHTFRGSFGFNIEVPLIQNQIIFAQQSFFESSTIDEDQQPLHIPPFERRVLERVMRGLSNLQKVEQTQDPQHIANHYGSGLNANMCRSLIEMTKKNQTLEWTVEWSNSLAPTKDVASLEPLIITPQSQSYLRASIDQLHDLKPEIEYLEGHVIGFHSDGNPQINSYLNRSIVLKWENRPHKRSRRIIIVLNKEDYLNATDAHKQWKKVSVLGIVQYIGSAWRVLQPRDFKIL